MALYGGGFVDPSAQFSLPNKTALVSEMGRDVPLTKYQSELMEPSVTGEPLAPLLGVTGQVGHLLLPVYQL